MKWTAKYPHHHTRFIYFISVFFLRRKWIFVKKLYIFIYIFQAKWANTNWQDKSTRSIFTSNLKFTVDLKWKSCFRAICPSFFNWILCFDCWYDHKVENCMLAVSFRSLIYYSRGKFSTLVCSFISNDEKCIEFFIYLHHHLACIK